MEKNIQFLRVHAKVSQKTEDCGTTEEWPRPSITGQTLQAEDRPTGGAAGSLLPHQVKDNSLKWNYGILGQRCKEPVIQLQPESPEVTNPAVVGRVGLEMPPKSSTPRNLPDQQQTQSQFGFGDLF